MPPLPSSNQFAYLLVESYNITPSLDFSYELVETSTIILPFLSPTPARAPPSLQVHIPNWECYLIYKYIVASTPFSLSLEVEIETIDIQHTQQVQALLDSRVTRLFMDIAFVEQH